MTFDELLREHGRAPVAGDRQLRATRRRAWRSRPDFVRARVL